MSTPTRQPRTEAGAAHTRQFLADAVNRAQVELDQDIRDRDQLQRLRQSNPQMVPDWKLTAACNKVERDRIERAYAGQLLKALPQERER